MAQIVTRWGNSLGLRIPQHIAAAIQLTEGSQVILEVSDGRLVVKPKRKKYSLEELLAGITPENLHKETQTGESVGNEF
jgi:antitoxin MazE